LSGADRAQSQSVAVVNDALVRRYWPGVDPASVIGRRIRLGRKETTSPWLTVVGVAGDVKHWSLNEDAAPAMYVPVDQAPPSQFSLVVRAQGDPVALSAPVREALSAIDAEQPVVIRPLADLVNASVASPRFRSLLLASFAGVALLLAVIGIYGVISYGVTQRGREIGIRLALGAQRGNIVTLVLRQGLILTVLGAALGLIGSVLLSRVLRDLLFGVSATDGVTLVVVSAVLVLTAALASYIPARRAARVDPLAMIRAE
jgi:putative ABC transport system permease protein